MGIVIAIWFICAIIAATILSQHNKSGTGCLLGFFLGPIGLAIAWTMSKEAQQTKERECSYCAERIQKKAKVCRYCGRDV